MNLYLYKGYELILNGSALFKILHLNLLVNESNIFPDMINRYDLVHSPTVFSQLPNHI